MQRPGTGAIRTQLPPSKAQREITKITNSQHMVNRVSSSFPKVGHSPTKTELSCFMRKPVSAAKVKTQISRAVTVQLIRAFVFATTIIHSLYFLNSKFQASIHLLWLLVLELVGNLKDRFSRDAAQININKHVIETLTLNRQQRTTTELPPWNGQ